VIESFGGSLSADVIVVTLFFIYLSKQEQFAMFCVYRSQVQQSSFNKNLNPNSRKGGIWTFLNLFS